MSFAAPQSALDVVILAAGQGTRMNSALPKVLHSIAGRPMLAHVLDAAKIFDNACIHIVIGCQAEQVRTAFPQANVNWIVQEQQLGTGHAVKQALPFLRPQANTLILYGDVPLLSAATLQQLPWLVSPESIVLLTAILEHPHGYGRIVRDADGEVISIIEQKDASLTQLAINEVNTGILAATTEQLTRWLPALDNCNAQREFYLTDIVMMAHSESIIINTHSTQDETEALGVNDRTQQARLERIYQQRQANALMANGVTLADPARFDCRGTVTAGHDVFIDINVLFEGEVLLGNSVTIEPNCLIKNAKIGNNTRIKANTVIDGAIIGDAVEVGPFARLRPGTVLKTGTRIGNFVETKNSVLGANSKAGHLAYIGDAEIGEHCNIGAGTITCNYDGVNKHKTLLGDGVFIGSNSTLVAPLHVESGGFVAAGSTVTKAVPADNLAVARGLQRNIAGWQRPKKKRTEDKTSPD